MSNNVVSQQFQIRDSQMVKMEHMSGMSDTSSRGSPMEIARHITHNPALHSVVSNENTGPVEPIPISYGFQNLSNGQMRPVEPNDVIRGFRQTEATVIGLGPQSSSLPIKRKSEMELTGRYSAPQQLAVPNKRVVPAGSSPRLPSSLQSSSSHKKHVPGQSKATSTAFQNIPALNKKLGRNDSTSSKSGSHQVQTPKSRTMQMDSDPRVVHTGSNDAVRSKMRDQLAAALSLVLQNKEETVNGETSHVGEAGNQKTSSALQHLVDVSAVSAEEQKTQESGNLQFQEPFSAGESGSSQKSFGEVSTDESQSTPNQSSKELRSSIFPEEDGLFVKDDLLQGNGLSWAYDFDMGNTEMIDIHSTEELKLADEESGGVKTYTNRSPEKLALEIEAELFKLFSGVNKKYKEKGRSLLFNLKDSSNPELRERVMSGKIPPDRLCSMTAEELASKELSEWRMAKAEEFAQMVVLPDTDFSRRRLVKKTHKGEYQVDFEEDYSSVATDVSGGPSVPAQSEPESMEKDKVDSTNAKTTTERENRKSENQEISDSLVIPNDGTDLMHGMMVDELKDAEFLPPIISLDDFMECLNSEPPFQDLQVDAAHPSISSAKETQVSGVSPSSASVEDALKTKVEEMDVQQVDVAPKLSKSPVVLEKDVPKLSESPVMEEIPPAKPVSPEIEHIWAGILQLSISSSITTFGVFKSGEKTSTAEWSSSLEIKGRVRLDAFEKFFKALPMSRKRAVMVLHLVLKDKSSAIERANLAEAVESYVSDERLGFAEPATDVELYVCPAHEKIFGVLGNYVVEHRDDFLNSTENSLIGIVVWKKPDSTTNSSSHHKHSSKRQQITPRRPQEKDTNVNMKSMPKAPPPSLHNHQLPVIQHPPPPPDDDDSDIPPGFGPASRDDDDLPEFNFAGNTTPSMARTLHQTPMVSKVVSSPMDQIRQLIHKYGQSDPGVGNNSLLDNKQNSVGLAIEPWNDDDDDMPEWRPNVPLHSHPLARPLQPGYGNQHLMHTGGIQQHLSARGAVNGSHPGWQHVPGRWQPPVNLGNQPSGGQLPSRQLNTGQRRDISRSRGF